VRVSTQVLYPHQNVDKWEEKVEQQQQGFMPLENKAEKSGCHEHCHLPI